MRVLFFAAILAACTNSRLSQVLSSTITTSVPSNPSSTSDQKTIFTISSVSVVSPVVTPPTPSTSTFSIFLNTNTTPINNYCDASGNTLNTCSCLFSWTQASPQGTTSVNLTRKAKTPVTKVQPAFLSCAAPDIYSEEIPDGTVLQIQIQPNSSSQYSSQFSVNSYNYTKNSTAITGSFQDSQGHLFDNILRYSCYQMMTRGTAIQSKINTQTNPNTGNIALGVLGTQFCLPTSATAGGSPDPNCPSTSSTQNSTQTYYYNLYIRNSQKGDINYFNQGFICPTVQESLQGQTLGSTGQAWPLDSQFALAITPNSIFTLGVLSSSTLSSGSGNQQNASCYPTNAANANPQLQGGSFTSSCLGFAAPAQANGTCPSFTNSSGKIQATYRLRRFVTIYPLVFNANGSPLGTPQGVDTIFVLDRPILHSALSNPLIPYTMLGPKPCPFAFFDAQGVTNLGTETKNIGTPRYLATSSSLWNGKNVDGTQFPNFDSPNAVDKLGVSPSCSTTFPVLSSNQAYFFFKTLNINSSFQHQYIRPISSFLPHYTEDTTFQACAPQSSAFQDPPLHFSRNSTTGNVSWCAEAYPTQNPNLASLDPYLQGNISPYTSHVVKNSISQACSASLLTMPPKYNYASVQGTQYGSHLSTISWDGNYSHHTCDRTVSNPGIIWTQFPLLATSTEIEQAISLDSSYQCTITYDEQGTKSTQKLTPFDGCCSSASVFVPTGTKTSIGAHLEPNTSCGTPRY
jgi:hypothetical protein